MVASLPWYQQLDALRVLRQGVRRELLAESKKQKAWKRLCQIPAIGPIRAAVLLGILQTPHRFRTKRPLWKYSGLAIETCSSADHRSINGQLQRSKKNSVRGLNRNCPTDVGTKDCHDRSDRMEEGSVLRRPTSETTNSLSVSDRVRTILGIFSGGGRWVLETLWFESESQLSC